MSSPHRDRASRWNVVHLDDHRAPDVDDMLDRVTEEAHRQDEAEQELEEPLPYEPEQLHAARDLPGPSKGELLHRRMEEAGEESQDHDSEDPV